MGNLHELAVKLAALLSRGQARDLFDLHQILNIMINNLKSDLLRIAFVVYGRMSRKDWRTVSIEDIDFDSTELARKLIPTLNIRRRQKQISPEKFGKELLNGCKKLLSLVLLSQDTEIEFLDHLLDKGEISPSILTPDRALINNIQNQPLLEWKALNVKKYKGH